MAKISTRLKHAWNVFLGEDAEDRIRSFGGASSYGSRRPDRLVLQFGGERTIISSILTRISIDVSSLDIRHVRTDKEDRFIGEMESGLNECLKVEPNIDQTPRAFRQDLVMTILDKGVAAIVPVDTTLNPFDTGGWDVQTMRVGEITGWFHKHVRVSLWNEERQLREEITLPKSLVAIVENPLYSVMNEPNSTLQRLVRKLNLLDTVDEQSASGKLDIIIQLPYTIKSEARREQARQRRDDIEFQLKGSRYGIAYADATEKITQLNRPADNNLMTQVEFLTEMLYSQLGLTPEVMNGNADEKTMLNYINRTLEPIITSIVESMRRSFLTKTARTQKQTIMFFRDPFKLVPISELAEIADKFTRNEILASNEIRQIVGRKPSSEPKADQLINSNMPQSDTGVTDPKITETSNGT